MGFFCLCWRSFFYSSIHFCNRIPFIHAECGHSSSCSCAFYSHYLCASLWFNVDDFSVLSKDMWRKIATGWVYGLSPICFNAICFLCEIVCRYLQKKISVCGPSLTCTMTLSVMRLTTKDGTRKISSTRTSTFCDAFAWLLSTSVCIFIKIMTKKIFLIFNTVLIY